MASTAELELQEQNGQHVNTNAIDGAEPSKEVKHKPPPIDTSIASTSHGINPKTPTPTALVTPKEKERKIGHRRVDEAGQVTYKKKPTSELMAAIQLGIGQSIGGLSSKPERDVLMQDFTVVDSVFFPSEGSNLTPAHHCSDFRFKTYAPVAFRHFRELFGIQPDDFLLSLCNEPLNELSNPGASGSIFYISNDDEFIIKTVQHKEADYLQKLLPGYYMNLNQNPRTLLPKFYGLYCYQCGGKNIRFVVMNNLLPSSIPMHEKYDLKGSTYKRKASKTERSKPSPTLKDLDFMSLNPEGIMLELDTYNALLKTMQRDCRVLESFKIMDYSFLIGAYNLDQARRDKEAAAQQRLAQERAALLQVKQPTRQESIGATSQTSVDGKAEGLSRGKSVKTRLAAYSTAMESIQAESDPVELDEDIPPGGIPARNSKGDRLLLYIGIIDILQSYRLKKKIEHTMKAIVTDGDTVSVHRPGFYATRFQRFISEQVFKKIPSLDQPQFTGPHMRFRKLVHLALKQTPSKKKSYGRQRSVTEADRTTVSEKPDVKPRSHSHTEGDKGAVGWARPDILPSTPTPPPTFAEAIASRETDVVTTTTITTEHRISQGVVAALAERTIPAAVDISINDSSESSFQTANTDLAEDLRQVKASPALSAAASTPTHTEFTEGTRSFTPSSPSCSSDVFLELAENDGAAVALEDIPVMVSENIQSDDSTSQEKTVPRRDSGDNQDNIIDPGDVIKETFVTYL